jgi:ribosomal subunit interface protein
VTDKVKITDENVTPDAKLHKYAGRKLGHLERFIPRRQRDNLQIDVMLSESQKAARASYGCQATVHLPNKNLSASADTLNHYAAVDIVEAKLAQQLKTVKTRRLRRRSQKNE